MHTYEVYDTKSGLFDEDKLYKAKNSRHAIEQYIDKEYEENIKIKRSGSNNVRFRGTKVEKAFGDRLRKIGRDVWYEIINE